MIIIIKKITVAVLKIIKIINTKVIITTVMIIVILVTM